MGSRPFTLRNRWVKSLNIFSTASRVSEGKRKHEVKENRVKGS